MITYTGKYNSANIMIDTVDEETSKQINNFLNHPAFVDSKIVIMPDCHAGAGAVIGFTSTLNEYTIPNIVGVDIGCGVSAYNLGKMNLIEFDKLDEFIRKNIPSGFKHNDIPKVDSRSEQSLKFLEISDRLLLNGRDVLCQLGTLGGGNHFIEIDKSDNGDFWLVIHTGSRNFGLQIANYYQKKAKTSMSTNDYKDLEYLNNGSFDALMYCKDMQEAQKFARINRSIIADELFLNFFPHSLSYSEKIESVHNYINFNDKITRKGAISAHKMERVVIPLNMRDGTIVGTGKGNADWNYSAPHGAGRNFSRSQARKTFKMDEFESEMQGIYSSCIKPETLDESPMAYKDKNFILGTIEETVDIDFTMKPVYNFKATEK